MRILARHCPDCKNFGEIEIDTKKELICPHCQKRWGEVTDPENIFDRCPICTCRQFYTQKKFNQALGCVVMLVGIVLVPWTYGLSLPVFAGIDWLLYRRMKGEDAAVCYRCGSEFHGFAIAEHIKPFMHHIGLKYDKYR